MKKIVVLLLVLVVVLGSCKKDEDPGFTSAAGDWTYTSPDGKITVNFTITESTATAFTFQSESTMTVDGVTGKSAVDIEPPTGSSFVYIAINANDAGITYSYPVIFRNAMIGSDFKEILAATATYTWPHTKVNSLTNVTIVRR